MGRHVDADALVEAHARHPGVADKLGGQAGVADVAHNRRAGGAHRAGAFDRRLQEALGVAAGVGAARGLQAPQPGQKAARLWPRHGCDLQMRVRVDQPGEHDPVDVFDRQPRRIGQRAIGGDAQHGRRVRDRSIPVAPGTDGANGRHGYFAGDGAEDPAATPAVGPIVRWS